jgi:hypothetical protein
MQKGKSKPAALWAGQSSPRNCAHFSGPNSRVAAITKYLNTHLCHSQGWVALARQIILLQISEDTCTFLPLMKQCCTL